MSTAPQMSTAPMDGPLVDPCAERYEVGGWLRDRSAAEPRQTDVPSLDVFLAGTVFIDMIFSGLEGTPRPGTEIFSKGLGSAPGGAANMAVAMSRLGLRVGLAAAFGDDMFGAYLWRTLAEQEGVDLRHSQRPPRWPTPVTVSLADDRDRTMITYGEPLPFGDDLLIESPPAAKTCFVDLAHGMPSWALELRAQGALVVADIGWDATGHWSPAVLDQLEHVDVFLPNAVEAMSYTRVDTPEAALASLAGRVPVCVVKKGSAGAIGIDSAGNEKAATDAIPVSVLDPTGAGDVFAAGFVFGTLAGWPLRERMLFANLCAGLSVRHFSGSLGAPCWGEIAAWGEDPDVPQEVLAQFGFVVPYIPASAADDRVRASPTVGYGEASG